MELLLKIMNEMNRSDRRTLREWASDNKNNLKAALFAGAGVVSFLIFWHNAEAADGHEIAENAANIDAVHAAYGGNIDEALQRPEV